LCFHKISNNKKESEEAKKIYKEIDFIQKDFVKKQTEIVRRQLNQQSTLLQSNMKQQAEHLQIQFHVKYQELRKYLIDRQEYLTEQQKTLENNKKSLIDAYKKVVKLKNETFQAHDAEIIRRINIIGKH
jgi:hypothetical protein